MVEKDITVAEILQNHELRLEELEAKWFNLSLL